MSEFQPPTVSLEDFLEQVHPRTVADMEAVEHEVMECHGKKFERLCHVQQWLGVYGEEASTNRDDVEYYEIECERLAEQLRGTYGEA